MGSPTNSSTVGAEATEVLGGAFSVLRSYIRDEERLIRDLSQRAPQSRTEFVSKIGYGDSRGPYRYNGTPLIITTESMAVQGRYILFWSGPSNTQWNFPMRAAVQQTRSGTVTHVWRNGSRSTFFDEPTVAFTFQAGNIMPVRIRQEVLQGNNTLPQDAVSLPPGLLDFYDFFEVLNQPKILRDGRPNFVFIAYHSLVYPEIFMRGFFTPEGLSFSEDAANPANLSWTATFKIRSTEPPFYSSQRLISSWRSAFVPSVQTSSENAGEFGPGGTLGATGVPIPGQGSGG